jgi:hypothetical protein
MLMTKEGALDRVVLIVAAGVFVLALPHAVTSDAVWERVVAAVLALLCVALAVVEVHFGRRSHRPAVEAQSDPGAKDRPGPPGVASVQTAPDRSRIDTPLIALAFLVLAGAMVAEWVLDLAFGGNVLLLVLIGTLIWQRFRSAQSE